MPAAADLPDAARTGESACRPPGSLGKRMGLLIGPQRQRRSVATEELLTIECPGCGAIALAPGFLCWGCRRIVIPALDDDCEPEPEQAEPDGGGSEDDEPDECDAEMWDFAWQLG